MKKQVKTLLALVTVMAMVMSVLPAFSLTASAEDIPAGIGNTAGALFYSNFDSAEAAYWFQEDKDYDNGTEWYDYRKFDAQVQYTGFQREYARNQARGGLYENVNAANTSKVLGVDVRNTDDSQVGLVFRPDSVWTSEQKTAFQTTEQLVYQMDICFGEINNRSIRFQAGDQRIFEFQAKSSYGCEHVCSYDAGGNWNDTGKTVAKDTWYTFYEVITLSTGGNTHSLYMCEKGGTPEAVYEDLSFPSMTTHQELKIQAERGDNDYRGGNGKMYMDEFYIYPLSSEPTAEPTEAPTAEPTTAPSVEPTTVPTTAPSVAPGTVKYELDNTYGHPQNPGDYGYGFDYSNPHTMSASGGDIDQRIWVNNCPLGSAADGDGLTISFIANLDDSTGIGRRVYYGYSGDQDQVGKNVFVGFKRQSDGSYRVLSNLSSDDTTDTYYTDKTYSGDVPVMIYITAHQFEVYVDGDKVGTVATEPDLGTRWYYTFFSYWAGNTDLTFKISDYEYYTGKAIKEIGVSPTTAPTEAPTTAPTGAPVAGGLIYENGGFENCGDWAFYNTGDYQNSFNSHSADIGFTVTDMTNHGSFGIQTVDNNKVLIFQSGDDNTRVTYTFNKDAITDIDKLAAYNSAETLVYDFDFGFSSDYATNECDYRIGDETLIRMHRCTKDSDYNNGVRIYYYDNGTQTQSTNYVAIEETYHGKLVVNGTSGSLTYSFYMTDGDGQKITVCEDVPMTSTARGDFSLKYFQYDYNSGYRNGHYHFIDNFEIRSGAETINPVTLEGAYQAKDGSNAMYHIVKITTKTGETITLNKVVVSYCPVGRTDALDIDINIGNVSTISENVTVSFISMLKGIPETQKDTQLKATATATFIYNSEECTAQAESVDSWNSATLVTD